MVRRISVFALLLSLGGAVAIAAPSLSQAGLSQVGLSGQFAAEDQNLLAQVPAGQDSPQGPRDRKDRGAEMLRDLNLTPDQTQRIQSLRQQKKDQLGDRRQAMRQANQELRQLMAGTASREQVQQKYNEVKALRQQLADLQFENMLEIREVLNPDQRQKLAERMQRRGEGMRDRRERRENRQPNS